MEFVDVLRSLHDGHLVSLSLPSTEIVRFGCRPLGRAIVLFEISGVKDLCANNFRQGNIILSAEVRLSIDQVDSASLRALAHSTAEDDLASYVKAMHEHDAAGAIRYFILQSSYGCDLAVAYNGEVRIVDGT
jgi:hypothetical protein